MRRQTERLSCHGLVDSLHLVEDASGLMTATQSSGAPFPEPILVSAGFLVTDLSGNILIQIFPPLLTNLVIAILAASICLVVIHPHSAALRP